MSEETYNGIAIVGMAGRFPGAEGIEEFWSNLVVGKESISFFTDAELVESGLDPIELRKHGHYVAARGLFKDADCFDATFFGVHPKEAEVIDPQHRVFLETCWVALERAGYAPNRMSGAVGIFAGATFNTYFQHALQQRPDLTDLIGPELVMFGNEKDYMTTRVAYKLGLKGPALSISTACSSSLVAVCQACRSLLTYESDVALAGGVSVTVPQKRGYYFEDGYIGSPDGHTRTFDEKGAGTVFSNGVAVVVLKRLEDAVRDKDQVYAVIKGAALNNDGSQRVSFGAPGIEGQSEVIAMAHALAEVDPETISYVEAHGTATPLGDPIEVAALTKAFRLATDAKQFCGIGSVKSNIGHLDAAAGVTGLIKVALALKHRMIPPSLHFEKANPKLDLADSPFFVNAELRDWKVPSGMPRRAGVSSFGSGGTNAHVVVEEAPELPASGPSRPWQLLPISAKTPEALDRATAGLTAYLKQLAGEGESERRIRELADAAFTLQIGRGEFIHRRIVACRDPADGVAALEAGDPKRVFTHQQELRDAAVVFMFPGQGAQYPGMGADLYRTERLFRKEVDCCAELLTPILHDDIRRIMFPGSGGEKESDALLIQTKFTQPALFVIEYALAKLWMSWGIQPTAMIGHSVGEYVAGCLAGVFSLEDALTLVARRGALVQAQPAGTMLAIRLPEQEVLPLLPSDTSIAAINSPALCVASGPHESIAQLEKQLEAKGIKAKRLHTSHAFHSAMMEPVLEPFTALLQSVRLGVPEIPYVSNVSAQWITSQEAQAPEYWAGHVRQTVRFADGVAKLMKDSKQVLLEVGPGQTLCTLARQHPDKRAEQPVLASLPLAGDQELRGLTETLGRLWMVGVTIDWSGYYGEEHRRRTVLPTYPFERKRYWSDAQKDVAKGVSPVATAAAPACGEYVPVSPPAAVVQPVGSGSSGATLRLDQTIPRKERLLDEVRRLMQELSGYDLSGVDASADLLELGLDSLLLTQAAQLIQRKFSAQISFRQLMEELSSLGAIASHLDAVMPPEVQSEPPVASMTHGASVTGTVPQPLLEQILLQQQQLTNQLLQLMGRQPVALPSPTGVVRPTPVPISATLSAAPSGKSHGPFKPFDKHAGTALSEVQKRALDTLIARYTQRTAGSKTMASEHRAIVADPRSVAGFNRLWKEMVYPIVTTRSEGSRVWDVDGNEYVDFVMGFGASLFGHRPRFLVDAIHKQLDIGFEIGPIQPLVYEVATLLKEFTGMSRYAFTNTGSEAVLGATRVARTVTGRDKIAVFAGAYHGIFDEVLFRPLTVNGEMRTAAIAPGIPNSALEQVIVLDYGNPQSLEILRARGHEIAAVLVEPVQSRRLDLQPKEFLHELRRVTQDTGTALVFDEIVMGFRVHPGGAQAHFGIRADLATYGKVVGGGIPIGVLAGDGKYMDALDGGQWQYGDASFPEVGVTFFAGTFVRHPLALAAAKAVLLHLKEQGSDLQQRLADRTAKLAAELRAIIEEFQAPYQLVQFSGLMTLTHTPDQKLAGVLFYLLRYRGVLIWENRNFIITTAHSEADLVRLVEVFRESLVEMREAGFLPAVGDSLQAQDAGPTAVTATRSEAGGKGFPLTDAQKEIWLAAQMGGDATIAYNESIKLEFRGSFDADLFRMAVQQVVRRHPMLLATITSDGLSQSINSASSLEMPFVDLTQSVDPEQGLAQVLEQEVLRPFDLVSGPLSRLKLVRLAPTHHVVVWTSHHIICDGWSCGVLVNELAMIYSAVKCGKQPVLDVPISFADYVNDTLADQDANKQALTYWQGQFADIPPLLDLPTDRPRPATRSAQAATVKHVFEAAMIQSLKRTAGQQRTTMVVLLMTALKALLCRITGQSDVVVGLGAAGQAVLGKTSLVGHCVNLMPIRSRLAMEASFQDNLSSMKRGVLDAYEHYQCTLGRLLQHLTIPRSTDRVPLVEVVFNIDRDPGSARFEGLEFRCERNPKKALHFDLFFNFMESAGGLYVECDYNTDIFESSTIARWLNHYHTLLGAVVENPSESVCKLPLLTEAERHELIVSWNQVDLEVPKHETLPQWFERQVAKTPQARAVSYEGAHLTYDELNRRANQVAHHLKTYGVGPDVLVGLFVERSLEMVIGMLAILKAGGAYVPIDPEYPADRVAFMLEDTAAPVLLIQGRFKSQLPLYRGTLLSLDEDWELLAAEPTTNPSPSADPEDLAYMIYTSGSTGKPKGAMNAHRGICNRLFWMQSQYNMTVGDSVLQKTPFSFDVSVWEFFWPLLVGARLVMAKPGGHRDPAYLIDVIEKERITIIHFVPSMLVAFLSSTGLARCQSLRHVMCSGEALPYSLQEAFFASLPAQLHNLYGPTEAAIDVTHWTCRPHDDRRVVPIGRPVANTQIYVLDQYLQPVPIGVAGELYIGGIQVGRGYHNRPELTSERFIEDHLGKCVGGRLYKTGDLARFLPGGEIEYLGRADYQVKIRGFRIELGEIEAVLCQHPVVREAVVMAREDVHGEKTLVAYLVASTSEPEVIAFRDHLKKQLPDYMVPAAFVFLERLPLTPNGKIDRKALPAPSFERAKSTELVAPRTETEKVLGLIWSEVLKLERIGIQDNFFELGGHSLLVIQAVSRIRDLVGVTLTPRTFFAHPTIETLAHAIEGTQQSNDGSPRIERSREEGPSPLSFAQERMWFLYQLAPESPAYNIVDLMHFTGILDASAMRQALEILVQRHDSLRTSFAIDNGVPVQQVLPRVEITLPEYDVRRHTVPEQEVAWVNLAQAEGRKTFDLTQVPLFRCAAIQLTDEHLLVFSLHHIIADEWSMEILQKELRSLYEAARRGQQVELPSLPICYVDYARWQRTWLQGEVLTKQLNYWKGELAGVPALLELPTDHPRPATQSFRGATEFVQMPQALLDRLKALGHAEQTTLFMTLLASFVALLHKYTGQDDIAVGTPISGRTRSETEGLIGLFLNTVVIRATVTPETTFRELLSQVREKALGAYGHQDLPFEQLVAELAPERTASHSPLFQVMFILNNTEAVSQAFNVKGLQLLETGTSPFDLLFYVSEGDEGLQLVIQYSTDLFDRGTIKRLATYYHRMLDQLSQYPTHTVSTSTLLIESEQAQLTVGCNDTAVVFPGGQSCLHELIEAQARRVPGRWAVVDEHERLTYEELERRANKLVGRLREAGVKAGSIVGLFVERSLDLIVGILGVWKAGAAYVPIDPTFPTDRVRYILDDGQVVFVLTQTALCERLPGGMSTLCLDALSWGSLEEARVSNAESSNDRLAYVIYTSGSTGQPKGVGVEHRQLANYVLAVSDRMQFAPGMSFATVSTIAADLGNTVVFPALVTGGTLHLIDQGRAENQVALAEYFMREGIDVLKIVPSHLAALQGARHPERVMPRRCLILGGEASRIDWIRQLQAMAPGCAIHNHYGPTETTVGALTYAVPVDLSDTLSSTVPLGTPLANYRAYVVDRYGQLVPAGVPGELWIGGLGVARGYLNRQDLTQERFIPDPFTLGGGRLYRTGDRVRRLADGSLEFLGRIDQQVKIRGYRIELGEIEAVLREHPGVQDAVVTTYDDGSGTKQLAAYLVPTRLPQALWDVPLVYLLPDGSPVAHLNRNETEYIYQEVFILQAYLRHGITIADGDCIIDAGANIGLFTVFANRVARNLRVFSFEPNPTVFQCLRANAEAWGEHTTCFPHGLSREEKTAEMTFFEGFSLLSGFYADEDTEREVVKNYVLNQQADEAERTQVAADIDRLLADRFQKRTITARLRTLSGVIADEQIASVDLLKVNVEKSELDVLQGLAPHDWDKVRQLVIEVDLKENLEPITTLLQRQGYDTFVEQDPLLRKTELCYVYAIRPSAKGRLIPSATGPAPGTAVPAQNPEILAVPVVRKFISNRLPQYMVPASLLLLEKLPLTANGKVDRKALPTPSVERAGVTGFVAPRTETEKVLASIWRDVLKLERVGVQDNFFELGGHSLLVIRAVSRIRDIFGITLTPRSFFASPTIAMLAHAIEGTPQTSDGILPIERSPQDGPSPLSFAQERMWFLYQLVPDSPAYNIIDVAHFPGELDARAMKGVLEELISRHDMLRTRFAIQDGEPVQEVLPAFAIELPIEDVRQYPAQEQELAWVRLAQAEGKKTFELTQPPLFRCMAVQLTDAHLLVLTLHHIIADEWSLEILQKELRSLYEAARQGRRAELPVLPIRYADFARWQRTWLQGEVLAKQLDYWKGELSGLPTLLELPTDRPRPGNQSFRGATEFLQMPRAVLDRLKVLGHAEQTTLFMTLLAGFMALLHKYTGQDDLVVGTPIAGRMRGETEGLIGLFLNTVVVRGTFTPEMTFLGLLRQVRERALGAYGHQDLPFEQLVAELAPERTASHAPLFQVMFILNNTESISQASNAEGLAQLGTGTSKFDLTFYVSEADDGLQVVIEYSTDLFDRSTIQRMGTHFQQLLEVVSRQPNGKLIDASLLPDAERTQVLIEWNDTAVTFPEAGSCVQTLFEQQAHRTPDGVALVVGEQRLTFQELNQKANQFARHLVRYGVGPNVLVGLCMDRSVDMVVGVLGILKAGGAYVPLDPAFPQERLSFMVEDSGMRVLVTHHGYQKRLSAKNVTIVDLETDRAIIAATSSKARMFSKATFSDLAYVLYTSGSTGRPKGVEIPHSALTNFLLSMRQEPGFTSADSLLAVTTLSFDIAGLELYLPLITGGTVVLADSSDAHDPARLSELMRRSSCSVMQATPATWWALIHSGWEGTSHLKVLCGGEPLTDELARELLGRCKELWNMYGPTETTIWSTIQRITEAKGQSPIGRPIANTQVFVMDAKGCPVPIGVTGELYIGGTGVARGYLGRPELTRERFVPNPFSPTSRLYRTGDLARWRGDGTLVCLGRADNQVKVRGFRIELGEVEAVLYRHEGIKQCAVTVHERTPGDKVLVAHFASHRGSTPSAKDLRNHLLLELPEYMIPSVFVPMDALPLTPNGKVDRKALPTPSDVRVEKAIEYVAPQDSIEQVLTRVWSNVLKVKSVGIHDNFFELGGHSILAVRIIIEIEKLYGRRLPLATLIQAPTIGELAVILRKDKWTPLWSSLVPIRGGGARPPLFLFHSHGGNVLEYYPLAELLDAEQPVYALQAQGLDGRIVPDRSMEDMVREYLKEVRSLQPEGPYYVAGFCFGGLAALEAAHQLSKAGETVAFVGMIQTMYPNTDLFPGMSAMAQWWYRMKRRTVMEWENLSYRGTSHIVERVKRAADVFGAKAAVTIEQVLGKAGQHTDHASRSMPYILERLSMEHEKAYQAYKPRACAGNIVLFRVQHQLPGFANDRSLGWKRPLGESLEVCDMPGYQQNLLSLPHVQVLAREMMSRLRQTQGFWAEKTSKPRAV